jgi:hypothetical protein
MKCLNCNKELKNRKKYCSRKCKHDFIQEKNKKICEYCKNTFITPTKNRKFCSPECSNNANKKKSRKKIQCKYCKKIFVRTKGDIRVYNPKFCSIKCCQNYLKDKKIGIYKKIEKKLFNKKCECCNKEFQINNYRKKTARFCSQICFDNSRRITIICPTCKNKFIFPKYEKRKYCSLTCAYKGVQRKNYFSKELSDRLEKDFNKLGVIEEYRIDIGAKRYFIDIYIKDFSICVEADGQYWHCDKRVYPPNFFHKQIRKTAQEIWNRDKEKEDHLVKNGNIVLRVKEYDWLKNKQKSYLDIKGEIDEICKNKIN